MHTWFAQARSNSIAAYTERTLRMAAGEQRRRWGLIDKLEGGG
jgi:hypothetical protein